MKKIIKTTIFLLLLVLLFAVPVLAKTHYGSFNTKHGAVNCRLGASYPGGKRGNAHATTYWANDPPKGTKAARLNTRIYIKNDPKSAYERKNSHTTKPGKKQSYVTAAGNPVYSFRSIHSLIPANSNTQIEKIYFTDKNLNW